MDEMCEQTVEQTIKTIEEAWENNPFLAEDCSRIEALMAKTAFITGYYEACLSEASVGEARREVVRQGVGKIGVDILGEILGTMRENLR